jgi:hypothetical protein
MHHILQAMWFEMGRCQALQKWAPSKLAFQGQRAYQKWTVCRRWQTANNLLRRETRWRRLSLAAFARNCFTIVWGRSGFLVQKTELWWFWSLACSLVCIPFAVAVSQSGWRSRLPVQLYAYIHHNMALSYFPCIFSVGWMLKESARTTSLTI